MGNEVYTKYVQHLLGLEVGDKICFNMVHGGGCLVKRCSEDIFDLYEIPHYDTESKMFIVPEPRCIGKYKGEDIYV